jgi:ribosomal protein S18 acetylase RimI-like enzyme
VTATNERAIRLYRRLGFRRAKTLYKAVITSPWPGPN